METKKFAIISDDGKHEYDITVFESESEKTYQMCYSNGTQWNCPGEHILTATDHGNGIRFDKKLKYEFDYGQITELKILLDFIYRFDTNLSPNFEIYQKL